MKESNVRYGVVNIKERIEYEKKFHAPMGYTLTTWDEQKAISFCRKKKNSDWIVEKIYDTRERINNRQEIYRSGNLTTKKYSPLKEGENEKNNWINKTKTICLCYILDQIKRTIYLEAIYYISHITTWV